MQEMAIQTGIHPETQTIGIEVGVLKADLVGKDSEIRSEGTKIELVLSLFNKKANLWLIQVSGPHIPTIP